MSFPITHILAAQQLQQKYFASADRVQLILGTSFPDIRYLGELSRQQTHPQPEHSLAAIARLSDFDIGVQIHLLVDLKHEEYLAK